MKTKKILFLVSFLIINIISFAQLKIDQYGRIGMGTNWPNPDFKCHIVGNLLVTNYPATPFNELRMTVGSSIGVTVGGNTGKISFWSANMGYNTTFASSYERGNNSEKTNVEKIEKGLNKIMMLSPIQYKIKDYTIDDNTGLKIENNIKEFGFIAKEIEEKFEETKITKNINGVDFIDFDQIIPIAVSAIQEQQAQIDNLKAIIYSQEQEIIKLKEKVENYCNGTTNTNNVETTNKKATLYDNNPNPFSVNTEIKFYIPVDSKNAKIIIHDLQGLEIKALELTQKGNGNVVINGSELKPGMYLYTLVIDNKIIDSKRMLLTKE